ncbi:hypothetical protein HID58_043463, partial [Brassica napus]
SSLVYLYAGAEIVVLWDTFDSHIPNDFTDVLMITQSALKEKGIYGRFKFRAYASDPANYPGFPVFWINEVGETLMNEHVAWVSFAMPNDGYTLCLSRHMSKIFCLCMFIFADFEWITLAAQRAITWVFSDTNYFPLPVGLHFFDVWQNICLILSFWILNEYN